MTPDQLAKSCLDVLAHPERSISSNPTVGIAGTRKVPLPKKSFPKWKYISNSADGKPTYYYDAKELLTALAYHGLINLEDYRQ